MFLCCVLFLALMYPWGGAANLTPNSHVTFKESSYDPEIFMNVTELITSKGYPCENHRVTTEDGYILNIQRLPHGKKGRGKKGRGRDGPKPVVMLQHGLLGSSSNWAINLANESLAFILADAGADVWLGNVRGNRYGRSHKTLKPTDDKFWDWSWDEMAKYDLPAMMDYILQTTGQSQLTYVGHSQGTMIGFSGFSQNKTLGQKVKTFVALAPVAKVRHIKSPIRLLAPFAKEIKVFFTKFGHGQFLPGDSTKKWMAKDVCKDLSLICENLSFIVSGFDYKEMNRTRVPVYEAHTPAGTSVRNMVHFAQGVNTNTYQKYDYGTAEKNMKHYGQSTPPTYHPEDMDVPVAMFSGGHDFLADPEDVSWIRSQLKHVVKEKFFKTWEHLDFVYAMHAANLCYSDIQNIVFG